MKRTGLIANLIVIVYNLHVSNLAEALNNHTLYYCSISFSEIIIIHYYLDII